MKTAAAVSQWLRDKHAELISPKTESTYRWACAYLPQQLPCLTESLRNIIAIAELAPESKLDMWRIWRNFFKWAHSELGIPNPAKKLKRPRVRKHLPRYLSRDEIGRAITSCAAGGHTIDVTNTELQACPSYRDHAMVRLVLDTGLRLGEVASLKSSDFQDGQLRITKSKTGARTVKVSPAVLDLLQPLRSSRHLWPGRKGPLSTDGVRLALQRTLRAAGIHPPKGGPHVLRHTFATWYMAQGGNVVNLQALLGHSSITTTMVYVHMAQFIDDGLIPHYSPIAVATLPDNLLAELSATPGLEDL